MAATLRDVEFKLQLTQMAFARMRQAEQQMQSESDRLNMDPTEFEKRHEEPGEFAYHLGAFLSFASSTMDYIGAILRDNREGAEAWERTKKSEIFSVIIALRNADSHGNTAKLTYRQIVGAWPITPSPPSYAVKVDSLAPRRETTEEAKHALKVSGIMWLIPAFFQSIDSIKSQYIKDDGPDAR